MCLTWAVRPRAEGMMHIAFEISGAAKSLGNAGLVHALVGVKLSKHAHICSDAKLNI